VYLPEGAWYDFWTHTKLQGGTEITAAADLGTLPLSVRAGSILPMGPVKQYTTQPSTAPLELHIYPGADGRFALYQDDGVSMDHTRGVFSLIEMEWSDAARTLSLSLAEGSRMQAFTSRAMTVRVAGESATRPVAFNGAPLRLNL
jgi:alpha-glucosidase (family GH31 glycosyl hydrolase)